VSLAGVAIGSIVAAGAARYVGPLLFGVSPRDPHRLLGGGNRPRGGGAHGQPTASLAGGPRRP